MSKKHPNRDEKVDHLKKLFKQLSDHRGSKGETLKLLSKKTGRHFEKHFINRVLNDEITFKGSLREVLDVAIDSTKNVLYKYENQTKRNQPSLIPRTNREWKIIASYIEGDINQAQLNFNKGHYYNGYQILVGHFMTVEKPTFISKHPYLYGLFHFLICKAKLALGIGKENRLQFELGLNKAIDAFNEHKDYVKQLICYDMLRVYYRQIGRNMFAVRKFRVDKDLLDSIRMKSSERMFFEMQIQHQNGISNLRLAEKNKNNQDFYQESFRLLETSNSFFKHHHDENWYRQAVLRQAELYVKSNQFNKAEPLLGLYEDELERCYLTDLQQIIFFRINCERYAKLNHLDPALKNYTIAVRRSFRDNLEHEQLNRFIRLKNAHPQLRDNLPTTLSLLL